LPAPLPRDGAAVPAGRPVPDLVRRLPPFGAHAWVEVDGVMVGEVYPPDYLRTLVTVGA
jgi:hypothetical protein